MAGRTQADAVLFDVAPVGHQVPVSDVVSVELDFTRTEQGPPARAALVPVTGERSVAKALSNELLLGRHEDYPTRSRPASGQHRTTTGRGCASADFLAVEELLRLDSDVDPTVAKLAFKGVLERHAPWTDAARCFFIETQDLAKRGLEQRSLLFSVHVVILYCAR